VLVGDRFGSFGGRLGEQAGDIARAAFGGLEGLGQQRGERLSRWSRSPTLLSTWLTTDSSASRRSVSTSSVRRLLVSICSAAAASALPCTSNFSAAAAISRRIAPVPAWNPCICSAKRELVSPLRSLMSFIVATN